MTDKDIAAMREDAQEHADILSGKYTIPTDQVKALLAEYGGRCAEQVPLVLAYVEQLRDIVQAVADGVVMTAYDSGRDVYVCSGCEREVDGFFTDEELAGKSVYEHVQPFIVHKPTCIVLTARQLLGK